MAWNGETKDLSFVPGTNPAEVLLVDDQERYVHPGQEMQWVRIEEYLPPYGDDDRELEQVLDALKRKATRTS